jgi:hypothetical protein
MAKMKVVKTYLFFEGFDEGFPHLIDTIFVEGAWWLVGSWLVANATGERVPERLVRLTGLRHESASGQRWHFVLNNSLPKSVLDGEARDGYVVANYQALVHGKPREEKPH